jgi:type I restriction enzyme S subunit
MKRKVKLKEVCREITVGHVGPMADSYVESGIPFLRSQNITPFAIDKTNLKFIDGQFHEKLKKSALHPGDVVVVRTGYPGTACVIPDGMLVANCADLVILRPSEEIDGDYLASMFNSVWGKGRVAGSLVGVAQQHFNIGVAKDMEVSLPPIEVQRRVSSILSTYNNLIGNNARRIKVLEEMAQMLYREWFVNFRFPGHDKVKMVESEIGPIPQGWSANTIGDLCDDIRRSVNPSDVPPETPYIGLEHMPRKSIALSEWGEAGQVQSTKLRFNRSDILFGKIRPYFHKVGTAPINGVCSSDAIVIVPKEEKYSSVVLLCASSDDFVAQATQTSQGTKMPRANWGVLARYPIAIPDVPLLERFNGIVVPMIELLTNLIFRNRCLRKTRDLLLPKLMSGEVSIEKTETEIPAQSI